MVRTSDSLLELDIDPNNVGLRLRLVRCRLVELFHWRAAMNALPIVLIVHWWAAIYALPVVLIV